MKFRLANGKFCEIDDEFAHLTSRNWGTNRDGYVVRCQFIDGKHVHFSIHREITNCPIGMVVDHIDGNKLNNKKSNLRVCTHSENMKNSKTYKTNTSGYKGVHYHRNTTDKVWTAQIKLNGKNKHLGSFSSPIEAARTYDRFAIEYYGDFARLNFEKEAE